MVQHRKPAPVGVLPHGRKPLVGDGHAPVIAEGFESDKQRVAEIIVKPAGQFIGVKRVECYIRGVMAGMGLQFPRQQVVARHRIAQQRLKAGMDHKLNAQRVHYLLARRNLQVFRLQCQHVAGGWTQVRMGVNAIHLQRPARQHAPPEYFCGIAAGHGGCFQSHQAVQVAVRNQLPVAIADFRPRQSRDGGAVMGQVSRAEHHPPRAEMADRQFDARPGMEPGYVQIKIFTPAQQFKNLDGARPHGFREDHRRRGMPAGEIQQILYRQPVGHNQQGFQRTQGAHDRRQLAQGLDIQSVVKPQGAGAARRHLPF